MNSNLNSANSKLNSLQSTVNGLLNYTASGNGRYFLNRNFYVNTVIVNPGGNNYVYVSTLSGYNLLAATNGDWSAWNGWPRGVARQGGTEVVLLNEYRNGNIRLNLFYVKTGW